MTPDEQKKKKYQDDCFMPYVKPVFLHSQDSQPWGSGDSIDTEATLMKLIQGVNCCITKITDLIERNDLQ